MRPHYRIPSFVPSRISTPRVIWSSFHERAEDAKPARPGRLRRGVFPLRLRNLVVVRGERVEQVVDVHLEQLDAHLREPLYLALDGNVEAEDAGELLGHLGHSRSTHHVHLEHGHDADPTHKDLARLEDVEKPASSEPRMLDCTHTPRSDLSTESMSLVRASSPRRAAPHRRRPDPRRAAVQSPFLARSGAVIFTSLHPPARP